MVRSNLVLFICFLTVVLDARVIANNDLYNKDNKISMCFWEIIFLRYWDLKFECYSSVMASEDSHTTL